VEDLATQIWVVTHYLRTPALGQGSPSYGRGATSEYILSIMKK